MDERVQFISDHQRQLLTIAELSDRFGIASPVVDRRATIAHLKDRQE